MKTVYIADDGKKFDSLEEVEKYEKELEEKKNKEEENKKLKRARQIEVEAAYEKFLELENKYYEDYHEVRKSWKKEDNAPYVSNADVITDWLKWIFE